MPSDQSANAPVAVTGVWLKRVVHQNRPASLHVLVEVDGEWRRVITEPDDGPISHIVEPSGIRSSEVMA